MTLRPMQFKGFFEEQSGEMATEIQVVVPESDFETSLISWALLPHAETVEDDESRRDYVFRYQLGEHLGGGLFALRVHARDASGITHESEIVAALVSVAGTISEARHGAFAPMWFISDRLHYRQVEPVGHESYHRRAFGHLRFGGFRDLPHRRLFGATV